MLNIIGKRLQERPSAKLTITGCNSDEGAEKGNTALSRKRAEAVRDYLRTVWNVSASRLAVKERNLPEKASNERERDGVEENRRVEITSSDPVILDPVVTADTLRTVTPPHVRFHPSVTAGAGTTEWRVTASQGGRTLKEYVGKLDAPATLDWNVDAERATIPRTTEPIKYELWAQDATNKTITTPAQTIPVEQLTIQKKRAERMADKEIDRYNLILFEFDSPALNEQNKRIATFIRPKIGDRATVSITGFTDRLGEEEYNRRLSEERAKSTAASLNVPAATVKGAGETTMYDNNLPEGRFYCRTVSVVVETPIGK
jgi:outer membrane protein OmpA-like peptidoglycan-associated protein